MSRPQGYFRDAPPAKVAVVTAAAFLRHAKVVGLLTLVSRVAGLVREVVSAHFLGTGLVASAFTVAFTIPNLFRKLFGEGALSAAFIPLYMKAVREEEARGRGGEGERGSEDEERGGVGEGSSGGQNGAAAGVLSYSSPSPTLPLPPSPASANLFAAAGVNLLASILLGITLVGELGLFAAIAFWPGLRADHLLTLRLTAIMLPYVLLICGTAFLSGVLQVHKRFAAPAAAPVLLNLCHIAVLVVGAMVLGLGGHDGADRDAVIARQTTLVYWLAFAVLIAGGLQVAVLMPGLRAVGFRFRLAVGLWTPMTRQMLKLTVPVAMGAGVVQLSVLLDRGISTLFMQGVGPAGELITHVTVFGQSVRYPMEPGAPARLAVAQFMYLFPLGIFATALATAIFPSLSADALERDRTAFKTSLRQGIEAALWEGIPASVGLILVCRPAVKLLFRHGRITDHDAELISRSLVFYAAAIWAFSLLQIVSRAFYAVHDMRTPLVMSAVNLAINLAVELPLIWWMGEAGMAVGTLAAFAVQAVWMVWVLDRRVGGLNLAGSIPTVGKMVLATALMAAACWAVQQLPWWPRAEARWSWAAQVAGLIAVGGGVYVVACRVLGVTVMEQLLPRRFRRRTKST